MYVCTYSVVGVLIFKTLVLYVYFANRMVLTSLYLIALSLFFCSHYLFSFLNLIKPADNWWKVTYQEIPTRDSMLKGRIGTIKERYCHSST